MTRARAVTDGETVLAAIEIALPPQRAFDAMTSAEVEEWWGESGLYRFSNWHSDLRVGGRWRVDVRLPNGSILPASGEYLVVEAPHRVTLTRRYDWDHPTLKRQVTRVTYRFEPLEGGTRVILCQDEFGSSDAAQEHACGWQRTLDFLHAYVTCPSNVADESEFLRSRRAVWPEIKSDNVEEMIRKILDFGVRKLDVPDPHLCFQVPGGQCFRLDGVDEDLSSCLRLRRHHRRLVIGCNFVPD